MCIIVSKSALHAGLLCIDFFRKGDVYCEETDEPHFQHPSDPRDAAESTACPRAGGHADTCSCGAHDTVVGHTPDIPAATVTEDQKCSVCGYVIATATGKSAYLYRYRS